MDLIGKPRLIRKINTKLILKHIRNEKITTKSELYKLTNLSRQTVNNIIASLIKKNLVIKSGYSDSTKEGGKRPLLLKFNSNAYFLIGTMIGLHKIRCGVTDLSGNIINEKYIKTQKDSGAENIINRLTSLISKTINDSNICRNKILGIGIGMPGIVDFRKGLVKVLPLFAGLENVPLKKILEKEFNIPVIIDNENRMRAIGEKWFGLGKNVHNFIAIITGDGIGAGIIIKNEIVRGINFICGEIGHLKLKLDGPVCACGGRGCFETLINTKRINELFKKIVRNGNYKDSPLLKVYEQNGKISFQDLFLNYNKRDKFSELVMEEIIYWFGVGISNLICSYDPEIIIIHGKYLALNERFFKKVEEVAHKNIFPKIKKKIKIKKSKIGRDIGVIGSASMVLDTIDF